MNKRIFNLSLFALVLSLSATMAPAQTNDSKPIEWVVGYPAGGGSDAVARAVAESMSKSLNRTIIVNNKPGAGTNIAAEYTARSKDYGNIVFTADFATLAANPHLFSKLAYNAEKDFVPVGLLARFPLFFAVSSSVPANNLKEFMAWAKSNAKGTNYASPGLGSPHHLATELFRERTGLNLIHVPYRGGAPAIVDVMGGQVPFMLIDSASVVPHMKAGKVKIFGVASAQRLKNYPEIPTLMEQGVTGFEAYAWQGLVVPTGTSPETITQLSKALQAALESATVKARFDALAVDPLPGTPAQMASYVASEKERWGRVISSVGVKLD
jgi:tripartite-type tricarboxylate transporter receptor subunit TctC